MLKLAGLATRTVVISFMVMRMLMMMISDNIVDGSPLEGVRTLSAVVGSDLTWSHKSSTRI